MTTEPQPLSEMLPPAKETIGEMTSLPLDDRLARLESLVEIYETALEELRERDDRAHALLITKFEALLGTIKRELRYARASKHAAQRLHQRPLT